MAELNRSQADPLSEHNGSADTSIQQHIVLAQLKQIKYKFFSPFKTSRLMFLLCSLGSFWN